MTRRFLAVLAAAMPLAALPAPFSYRTETVAPGVHAFIEPPGHAVVSGNSVAIVGEHGIAVVDTGHHPALTRRMIAELRALSPKPVLYVINTHWHNDHVAGNAEYAQAFPHARFVAHAFTAAALEREIRPYHGARCQAYYGAQSRALRESLASGQGPDGKTLTAARRERFGAVVAEADAAIAECAAFELRAPDITFEDRLTLRLGGRDVQVLFLGRGNTAGDAVVHVPDAGVVVAGDLVVLPFPFAFQGYGIEWARTLRRVAALGARALVPGHGPVQRDAAYLETVAEMLESVDAQVRRHYRDGMARDALRALVDVEAFRERLFGSDAAAAANFEPMVAGPMVTRAWQQVRGRLEPEGLGTP